MFIKICGVRSPEIASFAAQNGAHFVGMILTPGFKRAVSLTLAKEIARETIANGAIPVAVFVSESPDEVEEVCREIGVSMVQYYSSALLPQQLNQFYVNNLDAPIRETRDFLLMESTTPGSGEKIGGSPFIRPTQPFFLAGGLTPQNVTEMISLYRPCGVDVSSGIEIEGEKSQELILKFIQEVNCHE
jgi:phosphoribosylanthranilate isomerase